MATADINVALVNEARILAALARLADQMDRFAERLARIDRRQAAMEQALNRQTDIDITTTEIIMAALDTLEADLAANTDVTASAVTLLDTLHQELADAIASGDPARVQAVADQLAANTQALADAVAANTDAAPPVEGEPEPA